MVTTSTNAYPFLTKNESSSESTWAIIVELINLSPGEHIRGWKHFYYVHIESPQSAIPKRLEG